MIPSGSFCMDQIMSQSTEKKKRDRKPKALTSHNTTLVTFPSVSHSSLTSSLRSKSRLGSSSSSASVNIRLKQTCRILLPATGIPDAEVPFASTSESESEFQSVSLLIEEREKIKFCLAHIYHSIRLKKSTHLFILANRF